jgi:Tfp pilus assembly protein PilV
MFNNKKGQTIVELLVAVALIGMVVTALLVLAATASKVGLSSLKRSQAGKIATLGLETVRYYRDKDSYYSFPESDTPICYTISNETNPGADALDKLGDCSMASFVLVTSGTNNFTRQIKVMPEDSVTKSRDVIVEVRWMESVGTPDGTLFNTKYRNVVLSTSIAEW